MSEHPVMTRDYLRNEVARRRQALAQLEGELEFLVGSERRTYRATSGDASHEGAVRRLRKAIEMARGRLRRLEARLPASDEI